MTSYLTHIGELMIFWFIITRKCFIFIVIAFCYKRFIWRFEKVKARLLKIWFHRLQWRQKVTRSVFRWSLSPYLVHVGPFHDTFKLILISIVIIWLMKRSIIVNRKWQNKGQDLKWIVCNGLSRKIRLGMPFAMVGFGRLRSIMVILAKWLCSPRLEQIKVKIFFFHSDDACFCHW